MSGLVIERVADRAALAGVALERLRARMLETSGPFSVALSGGSTPVVLHEAWAKAAEWPWWRTVILYGDERCVPPEHADSNHGSAQSALLSKVSPAAVLRMPGEAEPKQGASLYAKLLEGLTGGRIDVAFLGMGADGHTASLFPGRASVPGTVAAVEPPKPGGHPRLTLTESVLVEAEEVIVLVSGAEKAETLSQVLSPGCELPLARLLAARGARSSTLVVDAEAAAHLSDRA